MKLALTSACALTLTLFGSLAFAQDYGIDASTDSGVDTTGGNDGDIEEEEADTGEYGGFGNTPLPVRHTERPITVPEMVVAPSFGFQANHIDSGFGSLDAFTLSAGGEFGITDDLMVEAVPLSVIFGDPEFDYGYFLVGATYRFLEGDVDVGGRFRFSVDNSANILINPGLPVRVRGEVIRFDTGLDVSLGIPDGGDAQFGFYGFGGNFLAPTPGIPAVVGFQIVDEFWAGLGTGFGVVDVGEFGDTIFVPLDIEAGGTIPGDNGPMVDIDASFGFPTFITTAPGVDNPITELWQIGIKATGYLQL